MMKLKTGYCNHLCRSLAIFPPEATSHRGNHTLWKRFINFSPQGQSVPAPLPQAAYLSAQIRSLMRENFIIPFNPHPCLSLLLQISKLQFALNPASAREPQASSYLPMVLKPLLGCWISQRCQGYQTCCDKCVDRLAPCQGSGRPLKELCLDAWVPPLVCLAVKIPRSCCVFQILRQRHFREANCLCAWSRTPLPGRPTEKALVHTPRHE